MKTQLDLAASDFDVDVSGLINVFVQQIYCTASRVCLTKNTCVAYSKPYKELTGK